MDSFGLHIFAENFHLKRGEFLALAIMMGDKLCVYRVMDALGKFREHSRS